MQNKGIFNQSGDASRTLTYIQPFIKGSARKDATQKGIGVSFPLNGAPLINDEE